MRSALARALATSLLFAPLALVHSTAAGSVMCGEYVEEFDGTRLFGVGENTCVEYAGTEREIRSGTYALMELGTGLPILVRSGRASARRLAAQYDYAGGPDLLRAAARSGLLGPTPPKGSVAAGSFETGRSSA